MGNMGKRGQKGLTIQMSLLVCSIFQFSLRLSSHYVCHHLGEQRLNAALLLNIISPSLDYSPESLDNNIEKLNQYGTAKNISHGRNRKLIISNPEEPSHGQNEVNNFNDSIGVKLQNWHEIYHGTWKWHEIYHGIWKHDGMKSDDGNFGKSRKVSIDLEIQA